MISPSSQQSLLDVVMTASLATLSQSNEQQMTRLLLMMTVIANTE